MGCNNSTLDALPAVALCRDRCKFIEEALRQSYAVADAHAKHMHSLNTIGPVFSRFFHQFQLQPSDLHSQPDHTDNQTRYDSSPPPYVPSPTSTWDLFNIFEGFDRYHVPYSPARDNNTNSDSISQKHPKEHHHNSASLLDAITEIETQFRRASHSGNPILEMLDLRYHPNINIPVNPVPCKMTHAFTPSKHLHCMDSPTMYQGVYIDKGLASGNLFSTLNKLCMWEKKLYDEVKAGEKLRILHDNKCRQLRRMNKKGADAHKVDSVQTFVGILATKIKISFQVVDKISSTISKLTEEELWPQISKFFFRFLEMWKEMLECYRCQYKEIAEAKNLHTFSPIGNPSNTHLDELIKLKSEVQNWNLSFSDWIYAQKSHVKALNCWLVRCLSYEPEDILDGTAPFSPGRIGAPPVFVICTKWSRAMDLLSEKDVLEAINGFILKVNVLLEKHISDFQQKLPLDKELERKVKILERQEQKMHKVVLARERKMDPNARDDKNVLSRGDVVHHGDPVDMMSLQSGLKRIFSAMERFIATIACAYEELYQQIVEDNYNIH